MLNRTKGPWKLLPIAEGKGGQLLVGEENHTVVTLPISVKPGDAKLMEASSELLEAAKAAYQVIGKVVSVTELANVKEQLANAILKAEGKK